METVLYGNGIVTRSKIREWIGDRKYLVVVDTAVAELYPELLEGLNTFKAPAGEEAKSFGVYAEMVSACNISYLTREGVIVALGGGATLDAAGFLASTYMRGIRLIRIPTTVIAMCDAGIGGKTAINSLSAKNEIGTFYDAESVVIDVAFLKSLPEEERISGMGEMMKYAIGFLPSFLEKFRTFSYDHPEELLPMIREAVELKQAIVEEDYRDQDRRLTLNFGHTLAHAMEFASEFEIRHGFAVAIGCYHMVQWAHRDDFVTDEEMDLIEFCYDHLSLPKKLPKGLNKNVIFSHVLSDKKMTASDIKLIVLEMPGRLRVERVPLDMFYDEIFKGPKKRYTLEEQWRMGLHRKSKFSRSAAQGEFSTISSDPGKEAAGTDTTKFRVEDVRYADRNAYAVIDLPVSKSYAHRYLILAAFADVPTVIERFDLSDDLYNTVNALRAMTGAEFDFREDVLVVTPRARVENHEKEDEEKVREISKAADRRIEVNCGSSASTARFLIPFSGIGKEGVTYFYGSGSLENRPMGSMINILRAQKILAGPVHTRSLPFAVTQRLKPGVFKLPGDITSQFLSGLLMAAPLMKGRSKIMVMGTQVSRPYVDITLDVMKRMGVSVAADRSYSSYMISPARYAAKGRVVVEKDYSQAAFFLTAEVLRQIRGANFKQILLPGLLTKSLQGDRAVLDMLGVQIGEHGEIVRISKPAQEINLTHFPDLFPIMSVFFALNGAGGTIAGADRVSYKESDRYEAMKLELSRLGARVARESGKLRIYPGELTGRTVSAHDDHRVAMSLMVLSLFVKGVRIDSLESIRKSYPGFIDDLRKVIR